MSDHDTLKLFYAEWEMHHQKIRDAIAPLTADQLALRPAPTHRTVGENAAHMARARVVWFRKFLGEGEARFDEYLKWGTDVAPPVESASAIMHALDDTWELMKSCFDRWTPEDMAVTFPHTWRGSEYQLTRSWVVWHILEHDLHHGGEISLMLGANGLSAPDI